MAKFALAVVVAALLCASTCAQTEAGGKKGAGQNGAAGKDVRAAQVAGLYTCGDAQRVGKSSTDNLCCQLCFCVGDQSKQAALKSTAVQNLCKKQCGACVAASQKCAKTTDPLPQECAQGLAFTPAVKDLVNKCASLYLNSPQLIKSVKGC